MNKQAKIKLYAKALAEVILKNPSKEREITKNFVKLLISSGLDGKSKNILSLAQDFILASEGKRKIIFETARETTLGQKKLLESIVRKGDTIKEKINPDLIAGVKIIINGSKQFDASMKNKLQNILIHE